MDGEVIVQAKNGLSDFAALRAAIEGAPHRLVMFAFDLLFLDGEDLRRLPLLSGGRGSVSSCPRTLAGQSNSATTMRDMVPSCSSRPALWAWRVEAGTQPLPQRAVQILAQDQEHGGERANPAWDRLRQ
jgi:hypothetical protein